MTSLAFYSVFSILFIIGILKIIINNTILSIIIQYILLLGHYLFVYLFLLCWPCRVLMTFSCQLSKWIDHQRVSLSCGSILPCWFTSHLPSFDFSHQAICILHTTVNSHILSCFFSHSWFMTPCLIFMHFSIHFDLLLHSSFSILNYEHINISSMDV